MGILNVTPDSFSDGGQFSATERAVTQARDMVTQGADIIDVGGESTRPGAEAVSVDEELSRVIPVLDRLAADPDFSTPISIDTSKPEVMRAAVEAGATLVNDVRALQAPGAVDVCQALQVPVCLMHMQGAPRTMQANPAYDDVVQEVGDFLRARAAVCEAGGIARENILLDPGFGFGKSLTHNLCLLKHLDRLADLGYPLLVGLSRKSMFQQLLDVPVSERLVASVAAAVLAVSRGARIVRVHDVLETVQAMQVYAAVEHANCP
ncbi:MAG TPA: dihydropteroate synthase [Gammaproteobacteria bacterium]|nr:dihydropteroate synthase [Gammaproteobacteria bacterium]